jgi:hypothetical protein
MNHDEFVSLVAALKVANGDNLSWLQGPAATKDELLAAEHSLRGQIQAADGRHELIIMSLDEIVEKTLSRRDSTIWGDDIAAAWQNLLAFADCGDGNLLALDLTSSSPATVLAAYNDVRPEDLQAEGLLAHSFDGWLKESIRYAITSRNSFSYWLA